MVLSMKTTPPCPLDRGFDVFLVVILIQTRALPDTWQCKKRSKAQIHLGSYTEQEGIQSGWKMKKEKIKWVGPKRLFSRQLLGCYAKVQEWTCTVGLEGDDGQSQESCPPGKALFTASSQDQAAGTWSQRQRAHHTWHTLEGMSGFSVNSEYIFYPKSLS